MKIGFFIPSYLPNIGGAEIALHNYLIHLTKNKKLSIYLLISFETWLRLKLYKINLPYKIRVVYFPLIFKLYKYFPKFAQLILIFYLNLYQKKLQINIWHIIMMYPTATICSDYFIKKKIPWVVRAIGVDIQIHKNLKYGYRIDNKINRIIINKATQASAYIASSSDMSQEYGNLNISKRKIFEIPNSVNLSLFQNDINKNNNFRERYNISKEDKVFLTVGRNHKKKGFEILLKAIKRFKYKNKISKTKFIFYGTNLYSLIQFSKKLQINNQCIFIHEKNNLSDFSDYFPNRNLREVYLNADIFICPSIIESFGIVIIEAMAAALPIIASNAQGCRNIIDDGKYGLQFDVGNHVQLSNCIEKIYKSKNLENKYKDLSIRRVNKYDLDTNLINLLKFYNKVISEKK